MTTKRIQTNGCASGGAAWWTKVPLNGTEKQRRLAALRSKEPLSRVTSVWLEIHRSAKDLEEGGKFEFDSGLFAFDERVEQETIDAIVKVFESPEVALIVDGRCATFIPPELSRDAKYNKTRRDRTNLAGAIAPAEDKTPAEAAPQVEEQVTSQNGAVTSSGDLFTSSLPTESSELERLDSKIPSRSVVVPFPPPARETTTMGEEVVSIIREFVRDKVKAAVINAGKPTIAKWLRSGLDPQLDIGPGLVRFAGELKRPLSNLSAGWVTERLMDMHADRVSSLIPATIDRLGAPRERRLPNETEIGSLRSLRRELEELTENGRFV